MDYGRVVEVPVEHPAPVEKEPTACWFWSGTVERPSAVAGFLAERVGPVRPEPINAIPE